MQKNINKKKLEENDLTQIFVEQVDIQMAKIYSGIGVLNQYIDIFSESKGIPDFYFYVKEEGRTHTALFVVEAKRLPAPKKTREYVIGSKNNGGIERYKKEIHGKNLADCGMLGFIEEYSCSYWLEQINRWIQYLAETDSMWNIDEQLVLEEGAADYSYLMSIVHKKTKNENTSLHHWWIIC